MVALAGSLILLSANLLGSRPKASGKLVDLGGHRLHVYCTGRGSPTVVVEAGLADFSFDWILVQQRVAEFTRICTYDRAGYGFSDPGPKPRTYAQINHELHDALRELGEKPPWVLIGHSFGGPVVRHYAAVYPDDVAGLVLMDTVSEEERIPMGEKVRRVRDDATGKAIPPAHELMQAADSRRLEPGGGPSMPESLEPPFDRLPPEQQQLQLWASAQPALVDAVRSEIEWSPEYMLMMHNVPQAGVLGSRPLIVLTRAKGGYGDNLGVPAAELESERLQAQAQLVRLSARGRQIIVNAGHNMEIEAPDQVTSAIRAIVADVRHKTVE
jgi:pimeloyl-ACP methyl ester carboxylesterase